MYWKQAPCPRCDDPGILEEDGVHCGDEHCKVYGTGTYQHPPGCDCDDEPCEDARREDDPEEDDPEEDDVEPDPEIQVAIFNWLAYEMASKYSAIYEVIEGKLVEFNKEIRRKRKRGELCLCCNEQPSQDYDLEKRWNDKGYCEPCLQTLKAAGEYCETCKYVFEKHYMQTNILCKFCAECGDSPRLQI